MELEQLCIGGVTDTYAITSVKKEFRKAVDEPWKKNPPLLSDHFAYSVLRKK